MARQEHARRHYYKTFQKNEEKNAWVTPRASDAKKLRQCRKNRAPQEDDGDEVQANPNKC